MTDRLHSCKDSPNGRHMGRNILINGQPPTICRYCGQHRTRMLIALEWAIPSLAREEFWQDIGRPADAHLGAVGGE